MAAQALMRLNRAVRRGRAAEAASWLRTWRALSEALALDSAPAAAPAPPAAPDPFAALEADLNEIAALAVEAVALDVDDLAGRRAIEARIQALQARIDPDGTAAEGAISDDSDELDSVFSDEAAPP
ncbi:hypothetical protein D3C77_151400 [compost metagenome]